MVIEEGTGLETLHFLGNYESTVAELKEEIRAHDWSKWALMTYSSPNWEGELSFNLESRNQVAKRKIIIKLEVDVLLSRRWCFQVGDSCASISKYCSYQ
jgi:hypothetical protein